MNEKFKTVFKTEKPIIGMLHLLGNGEKEVVANAMRETELMTGSGVTAVLVENYFGSTSDVERVLAVLQKECPDVVYGVNVLGDFRTAFELANKYGAKFIQVDSICGHLSPKQEKSYLAQIDKLRSGCDALLLGGVRFKYQPVRSGRTVREDLEIGKKHCDVIVVTGAGTGISTELDKIREFRDILGDFPLIVGAGMTDKTVAGQLEYSDGGIVGSFLKLNGDAENKMDPQRVKQFMSRVNNAG